MKAFVHARLTNEAAAFIQGWNDMIDAAVQENAGKPLTTQQVGFLILNLRYRFAFSNASSKSAVAFASDGTIVADDNNIGAIVSALENSPIADLR